MDATKKNIIRETSMSFQQLLSDPTIVTETLCMKLLPAEGPGTTEQLQPPKKDFLIELTAMMHYFANARTPDNFTNSNTMSCHIVFLSFKGGVTISKITVKIHKLSPLKFKTTYNEFSSLSP